MKSMNVKKHVLLTGIPGVGKTTLVKIVCKSLKENRHKTIHGFYTEEVRESTARIGFDVVTFNGDRTQLARKRDLVSMDMIKRNPSVGQYIVDIGGFEKYALSALPTNLEFNHSNESIAVIDEIGKMELFSNKFKSIVSKLFNQSDCTILATVPVNKNIKFVEDLKSRDDVIIFEVTKENRDILSNTIIDAFLC